VIELLTARNQESAPGVSKPNGPASKLLPAPRRGERVVELGFLLGWHVAELFYLSADSSSKSHDAKDPASTSRQATFMTTLDDLSANQRARLLAGKISTESRALITHVGSANAAADLSGLTTGGFEALVGAESPFSAPGSASFRNEVAEQDVRILLTLQAADASLGQSYMLARDLAAVMLNPADFTVGILRDQRRLSRLQAALEDLKSQFAQWAADAVRRNLIEWQKWANAADTTAELTTPPADTLLRQAEIWRAMLAGEKAPSDFLRPQDYLDANRKMLLEFTRELRGAIMANRRVVAAVAAMTLVAASAIVAAFVTGMTLFVGGAIVAMLGLVGVTGTRALARLHDLSQQLRSMLQVPALEAGLMECVAYATCRVPDRSPSVNLKERPKSGIPDRGLPSGAATESTRSPESNGRVEVICGECGVGNPQSRRFCRRCGTSLVETEGLEADVPRMSWWRRIFSTRRAPNVSKKAAAAPAMQAVSSGKEPAAAPGRNIDVSGSEAAKQLAKTLIALIVVGVVVGFAASPDTRSTLSNSAVAQLRDVERQFLVGEYLPVRPVNAQGSSETIGHQAHFLLVPKSGYWAVDTSQDPQPVVTLDFAQPTDLDYAVVTSGAGSDYAGMGRPRQVRATYFPVGASEDLTLYDDPRPTRYHLHGRHVSSVQLQILGVYPTPQTTLVALSELDFFRLK
jgi:hypothetical protein